MSSLKLQRKSHYSVYRKLFQMERFRIEITCAVLPSWDRFVLKSLGQYQKMFFSILRLEFGHKLVFLSMPITSFKNHVKLFCLFSSQTYHFSCFILGFVFVFVLSVHFILFNIVWNVLDCLLCLTLAKSLCVHCVM